MRRASALFLGLVLVAGSLPGAGRGLAAVPRSIRLGHWRRRQAAGAWDATKGTNIVWSLELPGLAVSSPIVWGDQIFVTTAISSDPKQTLRTGLYGDTDPVNDSSPHQWKLLAVDKNTGKILWEQTAHEGIPKTKRHPKSSQASPSPVTDGKVVVAYFGSEGLYAYSTGGKLLVEERPRPAKRRMVLRSRFGVGSGKFAGDLQEHGDHAVRPTKGFLHRRVRFERRQRTVAHRTRGDSVVGHAYHRAR